MTLDEFWELIAETKTDAGTDSSAQIAYLTEALTDSPIRDIVDFHYLFREQIARAYTSHLWAAAYIILGGCSDDWFDYFRAWLAAQGQTVFEQALESPKTLIPHARAALDAGEEPALEEVMYVTHNAYEASTGKRNLWDEVEAVYGKPQRLPEIEFDWEETPESLKRLHPEIFAEFWESS